MPRSIKRRARLSRRRARLSRRSRRSRKHTGRNPAMYGLTICPGLSVSQGDTKEDVKMPDGKILKAVKKCKIPGSDKVFRITSDSECAEPDQSICATSLSSAVGKTASAVGDGLKSAAKVAASVVVAPVKMTLGLGY